MSFSSDAKAELCRVPLTRRCCARAEAYGVLLYAGSFSPTEVRIVTESEDFAARLPKLFQKAFSVRFDAQESGSKSIFRITDGQKLAVILEALGYDPDQHYALHVNFALLEEECCRASFLRGAFLAGGSVTDPLKRYHLELATPHLQAGREGEALLRATPPNGADALRRAIAQHLYRFRGISAAPEQIVVGAGTEYLYNLIVQLLGREAVYGVEDPGYSKAARIYALGGARTAPVLVDEGGVSLRSLEMSDAQILHTSPNHQFPTGAVTPIGRRQSLLRWAEAREGRYIIEDDYDSEFRFTLRPIPTLQSIDRAGRVIYVNTFSRTLAPSLRISYMVLPKSLTERYRAQLGFYSSTVPAMEQYTLARFLDEEYFEAHINRMRKSYRAQRDAVIDTILQSPLGEHCRVSGEDAGLHFLLTIDTKCTDHVLRADAEGRGVRLSFLSDFALRPGSAPQHTLVIHYPGIDLGRLRSALSILEALLYFRDWKYKGRK